MRAFLPEFEAVSARSLVEALTLLAQDRSAAQSVEATPSAITPVNRRWQPIAGGTDLMVLFSAGKLAAGRYLDIWGIDELRGITVAPSHIDLGALTTFTHVRQHPLLIAEFPSLVQAAVESGAIAIQNRGTLGGNIANASPAADSPPALLAYLDWCRHPDRVAWRRYAIAFVVVLISLLLQGWTLAPAARRLHVALPRADRGPRRVELDLPGQLEQQLVGYPVRSKSLYFRRGLVPSWSKPTLII